MYTGTHKISYYDLDMHGHVKLSALLRMVHIAADINATELGIGFDTLSANDMTFILQRVAFNTARMPSYGEAVTIRTWPDSVARGTFMRKGDMYDDAGKKIMEWASMWILFNVAARRILKPGALPVELPDFENYGVNTKPEKIILPAAGEIFGEPFSEYKHTVRYADSDTNMHMNNSIYGDLIGNALYPKPETPAAVHREIQINYLAEACPGEEITVTARKENETVLIIGKTHEKTAFAAKITR